MSRRPTNYYAMPRSSTPGRPPPQQQQMNYAPLHSPPPGQASMQPSYNHSHSSGSGDSGDEDSTEIYNRGIHVYFQIASFEASSEYLANPKTALGPLVSTLRSHGSWLDVLHYGIEIENPNRGFIMIAWPDPDAALRTNDYNSVLRIAVRRNTIKKEYWLEADTYLWGVLSAPTVSFSVVKRRRGESRRLIESTAVWSSDVRRCPGYRDHWFQSNILSEEGREFIVMIGWDGIRAHQDSRYMPAYQEYYRSVEDLGSVDTIHVRLTRYSVYID
ncbi:uncharacterized protein BT62DRAFT_565184 [Guyanagaster necrorhizus]|uniref:Uncharacterized protein n=1 Tax=Guyanagaster necrorhizus TaxID=856835 RepID=A0A9P7VH09_9AGAR|nr:uncharacterized protein BT62DRAFT_565184 [Guyanagaster necrorhizus MCA 3950]KAG7440866.1 hypothetical protein BT62DRAFT_565184 [Guyanagaster necrorhizus MCA 3950]